MDTPAVRSLLAEIDCSVLGARIKSARISAGLTQGTLAEGRLSISYLSRIESGQRRPEADLLVALAARLDLDPDQLLAAAGPVAEPTSPLIDFAEIAVDMGDAAVALTHLAALDLGSLGAGEQIRVERTRAKALEATGDLSEAILALEKVLRRVESVAERLPLAIMLSRCHRELGELADATRVGEQALTWAADAGLEMDVELVQLSVTVAAAYVEKGELEHALRLCREALAAAESLGAPAARASAYWETSVVTMKQGDAEAAVVLARRALALMAEGGDDRMLTRLRLHVGLMELKTVPAEVATARARLTSVAEEMRLSHAPSTERLEVELGLARCDLLDGDPDAAWVEGQRLLPLAESVSLVSEADVLTLLGEAAAARDDVAGVRECLLKAVHRLHAVGSPREAGQRWMQLGAMLAGVGEAEAAADAYRAAAVSAGLRPHVQPSPAPVPPSPVQRAAGAAR